LGVTAWLLRRAGLPVVFLIHNVLPHEQKPWDRPLARFALGQASGYIALSERERMRLMDVVPRAQPVVCPLPVFDFVSNERIEKSSARRQLRIDEEVPLLLFFGIVRPYKGLMYLIRAMARLNRLDCPPHLLVAGEFWGDKNQYLEEIERLYLSDRVHIIDRYIKNEEIPLLFSAADAFAAPYVGGTQSGAVKIAAHFGMPILVSPGVFKGDELLKQIAGVMVSPPEDEERFSQTIADVIGMGGSKPRVALSNAEVDAGWTAMVNAFSSAVQQP
jgi:glycosyltransferase involved in cell wall biosynthesis